MQTTITAELNAALNLSALHVDELLGIAAESDERGPLEAIRGLLEALRVRHEVDDTTLAILAAVEHFHLPALLEVVNR